MKIATMATGGIGGYLAVKLSIAGFKVSTIARGAHLVAIKENGLILSQGPLKIFGTVNKPVNIIIVGSIR